MFFHVLKSGCKVEALQLSQIDRVQRALALYMVVAWRIARLMRLGRTCAELVPHCSSTPMRYAVRFCWRRSLERTRPSRSIK